MMHFRHTQEKIVPRAIDAAFPPSLGFLFKLRIATRVFRLKLVRRWRLHSFQSVIKFVLRPALLLLIGLGLPVAMLLLVSQTYPDVIRNFGMQIGSLLMGIGGHQPLQWRDAIQMLVLAIGIPAAFVLWMYRDSNMQATLENQRKDINLKEFQELLVRASGQDVNHKLTIGSLEVAAIHQLRNYLRGDFGAAFSRPAWELLKAKLATKRAEKSYVAFRELVSANSRPSGILKEDLGWGTDTNFEQELDKIVEGMRRLRNDDPVSQVVSEEIDSICTLGFPLTYSNFVQIIFKNRSSFFGRNFSESSFVAGALFGAHFEFSDLWRTEFQKSDLTLAHFEYATGASAHFELACLMGAVFDRSQFIYANFLGADLSSASFRFTDISGARFDGNTSLRQIDFRGSDCQNTNFQACDMTFCNLSDCKLAGSNFTDANLFHANLRDAKYGEINTMVLFLGETGSRFKGADLTDACVEGADLRGVDPQALKACQGMHFDRSTIFGDRENYFNAASGDAEWSKAAEEWIERGAVRVDRRSEWPHPNATF